MTEFALRLAPWAEDGLELLRRQNTPAMTAHLGGPETEEKLLERQRRYLHGPGRMLRIVTEPGGEVAGTIGYWEREWQGERIYETGYAILPEFQGRGLAVAALRAVVAVASSSSGAAIGFVHAFPHVAHAASNAVCRNAGFELVGVYDFEYPKGVFAPSNDWRTPL